MRILRTLAVSVVLLAAATQVALSQSWVPLVNQPNANLGLGNPLLLTDGTVILHEACGRTWYRLTPDQYGSYVNGTWKRIAPLPSGYAPLYFGSAVLPDGRVMMAGGEYNATGGNCQPAWTNLGAIYDPKTNKWTAVAPPAGWANIGDAQSVVLADGTYMQANCCSKESALLNATTLTWTPTGKGKFDVNDEEGWTLLPDGTVLTVDAYVFKYRANGKNYEIYHPAKGNWTSGPPTGTIVQLWDSYPDASYASYELGPGVLRPDGTVFY
ncbi:MAG: kelch repeat-containing protein, partial [Candidatus Sulfotelmatobacter sp.]